MEEYSWDTETLEPQKQVYVLVIYDIVDNKRRMKLAKHLKGYGFRVQKSAFEALLSKKKYQKLLGELPQFVSADDSIRVYKMIGKGQVTSFGKQMDDQLEDIILI